MVAEIRLDAQSNINTELSVSASSVGNSDMVMFGFPMCLWLWQHLQGIVYIIVMVDDGSEWWIHHVTHTSDMSNLRESPSDISASKASKCCWYLFQLRRVCQANDPMLTFKCSVWTQHLQTTQHKKLPCHVFCYVICSIFCCVSLVIEKYLAI